MKHTLQVLNGIDISFDVVLHRSQFSFHTVRNKKGSYSQHQIVKIIQGEVRITCNPGYTQVG